MSKARRCAYRVHAALQGLPVEKEEPREAIGFFDLHPAAEIPVAGPEEMPIEEEYRRCLHCGVCVLCDECVEACPRGARTREGEQFNIDLKLCGGCGSCAAACKGGVIRMVPR